MTNKQKIWLAVGLGLFIIPEVLWSPTFGLYPVSDALFDSSNRPELLAVILIQIVGGLASLVYFIREVQVKKFPHKLFIVLLSLAILKSIIVFYILYATKDFWS